MIDDAETIQVRMRKKSINQLDTIKETIGAPSRSDALRRAVEITDTLINAVKRGERILIESKNGKQRQILIVGLEK